MNRQIRQMLIPFCLLALVAFMGCQEQEQGAVVQGTVTIDGELAKSGTVAFHPQSEGAAAFGSILPDGTYSLRVGQGNTGNIDYSRIPPGKYTATVSVKGPSVPNEAEGPGAPPKPGPQLAALKYASRETSDLHFEVRVGLNVFNLAVERASLEEIAGEEQISLEEDPSPADSEAEKENVSEENSESEAKADNISSEDNMVKEADR